MLHQQLSLEAKPNLLRSIHTTTTQGGSSKLPSIFSPKANAHVTPSANINPLMMNSVGSPYNEAQAYLGLITSRNKKYLQHRDDFKQ